MKGGDYWWPDRVYQCIDARGPTDRPTPADASASKAGGCGRELENMQRREVIEESDKLWPFPSFSFGKRRPALLQVDCKKLNDVTSKDCFPLARIDDTLDKLFGTQRFSTLDLKSGLLAGGSAYWRGGCLRSRRVKGCSSSRSCPLTYAMLHRCLSS